MAAGKRALKNICNQAVNESMQFDGMPGLLIVLHLEIGGISRPMTHGTGRAAQPKP